jgi:hypothetical protein
MRHLHVKERRLNKNFMAARTTQLISICSKSGDSLSQISKLTGLTIAQVKEILGQATDIAPANLSIIFHMKQRGLSLKQISQKSGVNLEVLKQFLPQVVQNTVVGIDTLVDQCKGPYEISRLLGVSERAVLTHTPGSPDNCKTNSRSTPTTTEDTKESPQSTKTLPKYPHSHMPPFLYCCEFDTNKLHRTNLLNGEWSSLEVPTYKFKKHCRWSELPGGSLLITGGGYPREMRDAVRLDIGNLASLATRTFVVAQPPMYTPRLMHAAVYHSQYVYVLGGYGFWYLNECERYVCAESRWEVLPDLPVAGACMSAVELDNSLYALGGYADGSHLDTVQKLSLGSLTWELMQFKLPQAAWGIPCFKTNTQVCLVIKERLYSFTPLQVKSIKTLPHGILCTTSYYSRGTLYYESGFYGLGRLSVVN